MQIKKFKPFTLCVKKFPFAIENRYMYQEIVLKYVPCEIRTFTTRYVVSHLIQDGDKKYKDSCCKMHNCDRSVGKN